MSSPWPVSCFVMSLPGAIPAQVETIIREIGNRIHAAAHPAVTLSARCCGAVTAVAGVELQGNGDDMHKVSKPVKTVLMNCVKCLPSASVGVAKGLLMTYFLPKWSDMASCRFHTLPAWKEIGLLLYARPKWLHVESVRTYRIEN